MPSLAFFTTYALLVLFWAEIYYQVRILFFFFFMGLFYRYFAALWISCFILILICFLNRLEQYLLMGWGRVSLLLMQWFILFRWNFSFFVSVQVQEKNGKTLVGFIPSTWLLVLFYEKKKAFLSCFSNLIIAKSLRMRYRIVDWKFWRMNYYPRKRNNFKIVI